MGVDRGHPRQLSCQPVATAAPGWETGEREGLGLDIRRLTDRRETAVSSAAEADRIEGRVTARSPEWGVTPAAVGTSEGGCGGEARQAMIWMGANRTAGGQLEADPATPQTPPLTRSFRSGQYWR